VAVVVEVADHRDTHAEIPQLADHLGHGGGGGIRVHRDPHQLAAGVGEASHLDGGAIRVRGIRIGHRLDHDRVLAPDEDAADVNRGRGSPDRLGAVDGDGPLAGDAGVANARGWGLRRHGIPPSWRTTSKAVTQMRNANSTAKPTK
jgi:hypothetical protein